MRSTEAIITEIIEAYIVEVQRAAWPAGAPYVKISEIGQARNITPAEMREALHALRTNSDVSIEPLALAHQMTEADRRYAITIGGEDMHLIRWQ